MSIGTLNGNKLWILHLRDGFKLSLYYFTNSWKYNVPWFHWNRGFYFWWGFQIKTLFSQIQSLSLTLYREMCLAYHTHSPLQKWWRFSDAAGWICTWISWKSAVDKLKEWLRLDTTCTGTLLSIRIDVHFKLFKMSSPKQDVFNIGNINTVTQMIFWIFQLSL